MAIDIALVFCILLFIGCIVAGIIAGNGLTKLAFFIGNLNEYKKEEKEKKK